MQRRPSGDRARYSLNVDNSCCDLPRPVWIYVGRVSTQKNIEQFLRLELPGSKVVIGDGPDRSRLQRAYPHCHFAGYRFGGELVSDLARADVFVHPDRIGTFGLVMLEAMACGLPIAALPLDGSLDVIHAGVTGVLDQDLQSACQQALQLDRDTCRKYARSGSWRHTAAQFVAGLAHPARIGKVVPALAVRSNP